MHRSASNTSLKKLRALMAAGSIAPMLATLAAKLPADEENYSYEFKWDGVRALLYWDGHDLHISSRNQNDITRRYPELRALTEALGNQSVVLDGEIVAMDENDQPSFPLLTRRMHAEGNKIARLVHEVPIYYVIFDLLYLNGRSLMQQPLSKRREKLEELTLAGANWRVSPAIVGEGKSMIETARRHRLEGVVAKRLDSIYEPGRRSPAWRKIKMVLRREFVIGGWSTEEGSSRRLGAVHIGYFDPKTKKFHYAGAVGTGFKSADLISMSKQLDGIASDKNPFVDPLPRKDIHFVAPKIVVEVEYRRWPMQGHLQQASFKGVRTDKRARAVVKEDPSCSI
jgi:bifunctional non-homologous end joining protein LigD